MFCQLDRFKDYNDTYGNQAGDRCLTQVAQALKQTIQRPDDLVCRYGGEEFAIVLVNLETSESKKIAETILNKIESLSIPSVGSFKNSLMKVSIGIASLIPQS